MSLASSMTAMLDAAAQLNWQSWLAIIISTLSVLGFLIYALVFFVAPVPRAPRASEQTYRTTNSNGNLVEPQRLPCWHDKYMAQSEFAQGSAAKKNDYAIEAAEVAISLVVPAYNEEDRLGIMLDEACAFLQEEYSAPNTRALQQGESVRKRQKKASTSNANGHASAGLLGWEVLVVSDGSTDQTIPVALQYAQKYPGGRVRVVTLEKNRGKGGAVTHGMRHCRGSYAIFADADGASRFADLRQLVKACQEAEDARGCAAAIGSRAHLVGSDAVVKRSVLRNFLMHSFHVLLRLLTPPATSKIKDTQCGFKLFSRASLPFIIPHMHSEGWIFDVEMLMLAESAGIPMVEVPIGWKEVKGSKLNVVWDSLGMAWGLAVLRAAWAIGVYKV